MTFDLAGIAALIIALVTLARSIYVQKPEATKLRLDSIQQLQSLVDTATTKNVQLYQRVVDLEGDLGIIKADLREVIRIQEEWQVGISILIGQIKECNITPAWEPDLSGSHKLKEKYLKEK